MTRLASAVEIIAGAFASTFFFCLAQAFAWFLGSALGYAISSDRFQWSDCSALPWVGAMTFWVAPFTFPLFLGTWILLVILLIAGIRTENIRLRIALIITTTCAGLWAGHAIAHAFTT